jgi:hypothetical protein
MWLCCLSHTPHATQRAMNGSQRLPIYFLPPNTLLRHRRYETQNTRRHTTGIPPSLLHVVEWALTPTSSARPEWCLNSWQCPARACPPCSPLCAFGEGSERDGSIKAHDFSASQSHHFLSTITTLKHGKRRSSSCIRTKRGCRAGASLLLLGDTSSNSVLCVHVNGRGTLHL